MRETSLKSYKELIAEGILGNMQQHILRLFWQYPSHSDREISEIGHLRINQVTGRRNELMDMGCIEDMGTREDYDTGRTVHIWSVPVLIPYRPRLRQPVQKKLKGYI